MCGMSKNLEGGLLVQCDTCNKWPHSKCYNLDESIISKDDYDFYCMACQPRPELTPSIPATGNSKAKDPSTLTTDNTVTTLESIIRRVSTLEAEFESPKECLEDQKVQHKSQCRALKSQIFSLEEQNSFLERKLQELSQNHSIRRNRGRVSHQTNHRSDSIPPTDAGSTTPALHAHTHTQLGTPLLRTLPPETPNTPETHPPLNHNPSASSGDKEELVGGRCLHLPDTACSINHSSTYHQKIFPSIRP